MSRSTLILSAAGGALATLAIQGASAEPMDAAELIAELAALAGVCSGAASFAWHWPKGRREVRTAEAVEAIRRRRHRGDRAPLRPGARPAGGVVDELAQWQSTAVDDLAPAAPFAGDMDQRPAAPAGPAGPEPEPIVAPPVLVRPDPYIALPAAEASAGPDGDTRTMPVAVDADGWPAVPFATAKDATRGLGRVDDSAVIPADVEDPDGWEQLRVPAVTRSTDDLLWYTPAGPA